LQQLHGLIRLRVDDGTERLRNTLSAIPGASLNGQDGPWLEVECRDTKTMLARVITALNELDVKLVSLEVTEPNLERVFLHLTGRALRD
jgi:ABC-2 type transport system ATP-binding protein